MDPLSGASNLSKLVTTMAFRYGITGFFCDGLDRLSVKRQQLKVKRFSCVKCQTLAVKSCFSVCVSDG